ESQALPHTNHPPPERRHLLPSNQLAVATKPSRCRATRLSAPSKSLPKLSVRTAPSLSGFVCAPATPSGKLRPRPASRKHIPENMPCHRKNGIEGGRGGIDRTPAHAQITRPKTQSRTIENKSSTITDNLVLPNRYNAKRRHWRKTRLGI
ncbi:uncharacterized protein N7473_000256, partial [Penicillium subrubescens]|uniref:uncharacterized protein n=1 Tax=Penicillium subrubescens TaxID=1316194 RepID=UPI00254542B3